MGLPYSSPVKVPSNLCRGLASTTAGGLTGQRQVAAGLAREERHWLAEILKRVPMWVVLHKEHALGFHEDAVERPSDVEGDGLCPRVTTHQHIVVAAQLPAVHREYIRAVGAEGEDIQVGDAVVVEELSAPDAAPPEAGQ